MHFSKRNIMDFLDNKVAPVLDRMNAYHEKHRTAILIATFILSTPLTLWIYSLPVINTWMRAADSWHRLALSVGLLALAGICLILSQIFRRASRK